jgi:hypothetical protein
MILYRHPEDGGDTGGGEGDKDPEGKSQGDKGGAEEIGALKHQLEEARKSAAAYQKLQGDTSVLFNPSVSDAQRQEALQRVMVAGGVSEADVKSMMTDVMGGEEGDEGGDEGGEGDKNKEGEEGKPSPLEAELGKLRQEIDALKETGVKDRQEQSKQALATAVDDALTRSPDAAQMLKDLQGKRGEEHAKKVAEFLRKDVLRETLENLYARKAQVGQFNPAWIGEEAAKAAKATLEKAKALMVTDSVGKAPGVLDEAVMLSELINKDIKPPEYDKEKSRAENVDAVDNWTVQRLQQMAAQHAANLASGGESKA